MRRAGAWNVRGVERETQEIAEEAARRAGMSLGDWLDEVVAEQAAEQGVSGDDWDEDRKLDAIGDRLSRLSRRGPREDKLPQTRRDRVESRRAPEPEKAPPSQDALRAQQRIEEALSKFEARATRSEQRTTKALESVASWIETREADRDDERATLQSVAESLSALERRAREAEKAAPAPVARVEAVEDELDTRLDELARRVNARRTSPVEGRRPAMRPRIDVRDSVSRIAMRQSQLDSRQSPLARALPVEAPVRQDPRTSAWRHFGVDAAETVPAYSTPPDRAPTVARDRPAPSAHTLRDEVAGLRSRLDRLRAAQAETGLPAGAEDIRAGVASMTRSVADLAPRNGSVALEGAVGDLGHRLSAARAAGASDHVLAPVEGMLREVLETLRDRDPQFAAEGLEREVRRLSAKVETLASASINPATLEHIRLQTEDVRNLLAAAASRSVPVEKLERQIGELANRIERLATSPTPHVDTERVLRSLAEARDQIERSTPPAVLGSIERRLEQLAERIDEALRRPAPAPAMDLRPLEDLARRIESVRASVDRQAQGRPDTVALESALREINKKLDQPPAADTSAIEASLQGLSARLEEAFRKPVAANFDTRPLEDLTRRIDGVRASVDRQPDFVAHTAKLEAALADISAKLDRPVSGVEAKALNTTLQSLTARLEDAFRKPASAVIDTRPLDELARGIEGVRVSLERQSASTPDVGKLEAALARISEKLDKQASWDDSHELVEVIQGLANRIDRHSPSPVDVSPLESMLRSLSDKIDATPPARLDTRPIESLIHRLDAKIDATAPAQLDTRPIEELFHRLDAKIDAQPSLHLDTRPIEDLFRRLDAKIDAQPPVHVDTRPIEELFHRLDAKIDDVAPRLDMRPLEDLLSRLDAKIDDVAERPVDTRPIEQAIRDLGDRLELRNEPQIDARLVEQAADILAKRLEKRGGAIDADALVNQISEIHGRIDTLGLAASSNAALERTVSELIEELETTRKLLQAPVAHDEIAELRAEQISSDRRMAARISGLQDILEQLIGRTARLQGDDVDEVAPSPQRPETPSVAAPAKPAAAPKAREEDLRAIPDRAPTADRRQGSRTLDTSGFLIEPGAPRARRETETEAPPAKTAGINAHIAAARRAAQAAVAERANRSPAEEAAEAAAGQSIVSRVQQQAQALLASGRRPLLLGAAVLAVAATIAVYELRGNRSAPLQKSEAPTTASPTPLASAPPSSDSAKAAAKVDFSPTGAIDKAKPDAPKSETPGATAPRLDSPSGADIVKPTLTSVRPAADLAAAIPAGLPPALRDAANLGDPAAENELAMRSIEGRGVVRDPKLAARWFEAAATQGQPFAQYRLAALYEKGMGVNRDAALARTWYLKAANAGNARAMHNLAVLYAEDAGSGKPDYAEAAQWFRKAAQLGVRDSQFNLGVLYGRGLGVPQDLVQCWVWFSLATRQGDADAGKKRDEVAAKLDPDKLAAASKALADFVLQPMNPAANEAPSPAGGWDPKNSSPQAARPAPSGQSALPSPNGKV